MIQWLREIDTGPWAALGAAIRAGLPVPNGFVVEPKTPEQEIRSAYEELKRAERTHFVAVRGPSHALLDILGNDTVIHAIRRLWTETPEAPILIQRMVNAEWCGKAARNPKNLLLRIKANEGMLLLDPDSYVLNRATGKCTRRSLQKAQRKMVRWVDGTSRTVQADSRQTGLSADHLKAITELVESAQADVTWALDDRRVSLISITRW